MEFEDIEQGYFAMYFVEQDEFYPAIRAYKTKGGSFVVWIGGEHGLRPFDKCKFVSRGDYQGKLVKGKEEKPVAIFAPVFQGDGQYDELLFQTLIDEGRAATTTGDAQIWWEQESNLYS